MVFKPSFATVETVGSLLSAARRQKDLSVQQVADQLKLSQRQILALESNQYDALPQMVIVRGFIRAYAKLLKIDADAVVALLPAPVSNAQLESALKPALSTPFLESRLSLMGRQDNNHKYLFGAALLAVLALGFFLLQKFEHAEIVGRLFSSASNQSENVASVNLNQSSGATPIVAADAIPIQSIANVPPASMAALEVPVVSKGMPDGVGASKVAESVTDKQVVNAPAIIEERSSSSLPLASADASSDVLKLKFRQDAWIQLKKENGNVITSHMGRAGTEEVLMIKEPSLLRVGNAAGVDAFLRGRPLEMLPLNGSNVVNLNLK
ncbi:helix-turn-helix domain-containing protein [Undibacterium sp. Ren11W]